MGLAVRVIQTLLYRGEQLVKGERFNPWRTVGHIEQAARICGQRGVDEIVMLDVAATPERRGPDFALVERISENFFTPLAVGGGIRTVDDVDRLLRVGADKVAIRTGAIAESTLVYDCARRFGNQAIVVAIDVQGDGRVRTLGAGPGPVGWARDLERVGAGEILLTSIDREGTMQGYDLDLIRAVCQAVDIPVIAHGGCSGPADMLAAIKAGAHAVAAGALFQFSDTTPLDCAKWLKDHGVHTRIPARLPA